MNKIIKQLGQCLGIVAINLAFITPAHSNPSIRIPTSSNRTCQQSIDFVSRELASKGAFIPYVNNRRRTQPSVSRKNGNFAQDYYSYPANRPELVEFRLSGDEMRLWQGVMSSPQFLATLAAQIMASCPQVGMVNYQHSWEGMAPVGYFSDGTARAFTWVDVEDTRLKQWGYYYSP